jgi:hypothetical protein
MPQASATNPEEINTSNTLSKRLLEDDPAAPSPSHLSSAPKKQKTDKDEAVQGAPSSTNTSNGNGSGNDIKSTIDGPKNTTHNKVDPTELASAFALASLASLSPGSNARTAITTKEESRDVNMKDHKQGGVRNMESWDETRSPKADPHHPHSPEQRSPGSAAGIQYTPPSAMTLEDRNTSGGSRKVTFAPNTKETSSPSTPLRVRLAASRRLAMPIHRAPMPPPGSDNGSMIVSPRPHRMYGGMPPPPYMRTPPHMPSPHMHHGPPPPPPPPPHHHPAYHHHHPHHHPGQMHSPGAFHHPSPHHHYGSPAGGPSHWHGGGPPRMGYPPRHLLQPPLMHRSNEPIPPKTPNSNQWICDFCNVASFGTYEEACLHEESCKLRVLSMSSSGEERTIAMSRSRSQEEEVAAPAAAEVYSSVPPTDVKEQEWFDGTMSLAMEESDREWLSELNCYIRAYCIEVFSATAEDVASPVNRNRISLQQVGVRCCFCKPSSHSAGKREGGNDHQDGPEETSKNSTPSAAAVSYPTTIAGIYESVKRWQRVHLEVCSHIPESVHDELSVLANDNVWVPTTRQYWADSARALGLVDTNEGIRFGKDPAKVHDDAKRITKVPSGEEPHHYPPGGSMAYPPGYHPSMMHHHHHHHPAPSYAPHPGMLRMDHLHQAVRVMSQEGAVPPPSPAGAAPASHPNTALQQQQLISLGGYIVYPHDMEMIPPYVYFLMRQVEPCLFTEADRFVARSKGPVGYPGFQCRHCQGHAGLGKYFPVSSKSLSTNSTSQNIHAHLLKCRKCPNVVKDRLVQLKIEKSRAPRLEPGWRKVFFDKVWARLHQPGTEPVVSSASSSSMIDEVKVDCATSEQEGDDQNQTTQEV